MTAADARLRFRRLTELYVEGRAVSMRDGSHIWVQALNPFERDEATKDFQVSRSRIMYGLKNQESQEHKTARSTFDLADKAQIVIDLVEAKLGTEYPKILQTIEQDPDWSERVEVLRRSQELAERDESDPERMAVDAIAREWLDEIDARVKNARHDLTEKYQAKEDDGLFEEFLETLIDQRGAEAGIVEYRVTEFWYSVRACDATLGDDGNLDHAECDHSVRLFDKREDVRTLPAELYKEIVEALESLELSEYDAKN